MDCLITGTEHLPHMNARAYTTNVPLITGAPFAANFNGEPDDITLRMLLATNAPLLNLMLEFVRSDHIAQLTFDKNRLVVMSNSEDWEKVEEELFAALKKAYGFDQVRRLN